MHTSGPWKTFRHAGTQSGPFWGIWANKDDRIAVVDAAGPIDECNARLIAAAPDLLAACKGLLDHALAEHQFAGERLIESARTAIAKAEGGSKG